MGWLDGSVGSTIASHQGFGSCPHGVCLWSLHVLPVFPLAGINSYTKSIYPALVKNTPLETDIYELFMCVPPHKYAALFLSFLTSELTHFCPDRTFLHIYPFSKDENCNDKTRGTREGQDLNPQTRS